MYRFIRGRTVVVAFGLLLAALPVRGDEPSKASVRKVTASSTATVLVKPDAARISFRIGASEEVGKSARDANEAQVKKIRAALEAQPIDLAMMDVQITSSSVNPTVVVDINRPGERSLKSKRADTDFHVTVSESNPDKLREMVGRIAEIAADNGATAPDSDDTNRPYVIQRRLVGGFGGAGNPDPEQMPGATIEWLRQKSADARRTAVQRAVAAAMADAQAAVGEAKLTVLEIEVSSAQDEAVFTGVRRILSSTQAGQIPIRVHVKVTCTY